MTVDQTVERPSPTTTKPSRFSRIPGFGRPTPRFVFVWAIVQLIANVGIVATGGAVRVTDSGLGCPTWPQCTSESFVPHAELGIHGAIEFGNRMLTWVLVVVAIATWVAVMRSTRTGKTDRVLATLIALGIPFQGVIGGITVLTQLNPWVVSLHFLLSMALVSMASWLVFRVRPGALESIAATSAQTPAWLPPIGRAVSGVVYVLTWVTIYVGTVVTGSGPYAGDIDAPRNGLSPDRMTQLHSDAVFALLGVALALLIVVRMAKTPQTRSTTVFFGLLLLQGAIGLIQYATDLPVALVIAHMLGSGILLIGATWLVLDFSARSSGSAPADTPTREDAAAL